MRASGVAAPEDALRAMSAEVERLTLELEHAREELRVGRLALREQPTLMAEAERRGERKGIARAAQIVAWMATALRRDPANEALAMPLVRAQAAIGELSV